MRRIQLRSKSLSVTSTPDTPKEGGDEKAVNRGLLQRFKSASSTSDNGGPQRNEHSQQHHIPRKWQRSPTINIGAGSDSGTNRLPSPKVTPTETNSETPSNRHPVMISPRTPMLKPRRDVQSAHHSSSSPPWHLSNPQVQLRINALTRIKNTTAEEDQNKDENKSGGQMDGEENRGKNMTKQRFLRTKQTDALTYQGSNDTSPMASDKVEGIPTVQPSISSRRYHRQLHMLSSKHASPEPIGTESEEQCRTQQINVSEEGDGNDAKNNSRGLLDAKNNRAKVKMTLNIKESDEDHKPLLQHLSPMNLSRVDGVQTAQENLTLQKSHFSVYSEAKTTESKSKDFVREKNTDEEVDETDVNVKMREQMDYDENREKVATTSKSTGENDAEDNSKKDRAK
eukprot:9631233-Ditylum_brightwellii.AAC.1